MSKVTSTPRRSKNAKHSKKKLQYRQSKKCCEGELKNIDNNFVVALSPNNGSSGSWSLPILLNLVNVGPDPTQRIGRKVNLKSLLLRCTITALVANAPAQLRVLVVYDNQTNGAAPVQSDILQFPTFTESPMKLGTAERFKVIMDYMINLEGGTQSVGIGGILSEPQYRKLKGKDMLFQSTLGSILDISKGAMWLLVATNALNSSNPSLTFYSRTRFTDM